MTDPFSLCYFDDRRNGTHLITDTAKNVPYEQTFTIPNVIFPLIKVKGKTTSTPIKNEVMGACTLSESERECGLLRESLDFYDVHIE